MRRVFLLMMLAAAACGGGGSTKTCGTTTSCSGCCTDDDRCVVEVRDRDIYCGFSGASCVDCTKTGKTCSTQTLGCQ